MNAILNYGDFKLKLYLHNGNVFFTDDIVEVLNVSTKQIEDIRSQTCNIHSNPSPFIIGSRYKLKILKNMEFSGRRSVTYEEWNEICKDPKYWIADLTYILEEWNHGGHFADRFKPEQLTLHRRPLRNWLKYLWLNITKKYNP